MGLNPMPPVRDLLLCAKNLFVDAMVQKTAAVRQRRSGDGRRARPRWRHLRRAGEGIVLRLGGPLSGKHDIQPTSPNDRSRPISDMSGLFCCDARPDLLYLGPWPLPSGKPHEATGIHHVQRREQAGARMVGRKDPDGSNLSLLQKL